MTSPSEELAIVEADPQNLVVRRPPEAVLEEAQKAAAALKRVLDAKPRKVTFNGEQYLEFEDWQTLGRFYGITAKIVQVEFVDYGMAKGFTARAVALRSDGAEISGAEAECLTDEPKWRSRTKYEWRDKPAGGREKVEVGEEPVPLFQLKSMAQTRACSKVLRNVLSWVVVLAGYRPTPAEEIQDQHGASVVEGEIVGRGGAPSGAQADGVLRVKSYQPSAGEKKPWRVALTDGRDGSSFDTGEILSDVEKALKDGLPCEATFESVVKNNRTYSNLKTFRIVKAPEPELPLVDDEPVGEPEKVLVVRGTATAEGTKYWEVNTDRRTYVTKDEGVSKMLDVCREMGNLVIVAFERGAKANILSSYTLVPEKVVEAK